MPTANSPLLGYFTRSGPKQTARNTTSCAPVGSMLQHAPPTTATHIQSITLAASRWRPQMLLLLLLARREYPHSGHNSDKGVCSVGGQVACESAGRVMRFTSVELDVHQLRMVRSGRVRGNADALPPSSHSSSTRSTGETKCCTEHNRNSINGLCMRTEAVWAAAGECRTKGHGRAHICEPIRQFRRHHRLLRLSPPPGEVFCIDFTCVLTTKSGTEDNGYVRRTAFAQTLSVPVRLRRWPEWFHILIGLDAS